MRGLLISIFVFVILLPNSHSLIISEIMYNPLGNDIDHEWIELSNNGNNSITITDLRLFEDSTNHIINLYQGDEDLEVNEYAVIAENPANFLLEYPDYKGDLFDSAFTLSNSEDILAIIDLKNNITLDELHYFSNYGASDNGFSLSRSDGEFIESVPTPGSPNIIRDICDWKISLGADSIFPDSNSFEFNVIIEKIIGNEANLTISRIIEDEFNNDIKQYDPLNRFFGENSSKETLKLSPNLKEGSPYLIKAEIIEQSCEDRDISNNNVEKLVYIRGKPKINESSIKIESILDLGSDKNAEFGQVIRAKLNVYKGDTTKESIKIYAKNNKGKISKESRTSVFDKFMQYSLTLPLQLEDNCDGEYKDGEYSIIAEGLDAEDQLDFDIEGIGNICSSEEKTKNNLSKSSKLEIIDLPESIKFGELLKSNIKLHNIDVKKHSYELYSYVYSGSKSYSGDRKENLMVITLDGKEEIILELTNKLDIQEAGNYRYKAVLTQDNLKTPSEASKDIIIEDELNSDNLEFKSTFNDNILKLDVISDGISVKSESLDLSEYLPSQKNNLYNKEFLKKGIIYESNNEKIKKLIPLFIIIISVILNILFIWKK